MIVSKIVIIVAILFCLLIFYYSVLTVFGLIFKVQYKETKVELKEYPSVDILIPAYNEGKVLFDTLDAMVNLHYPG